VQRSKQRTTGSSGCNCVLRFLLGRLRRCLLLVDACCCLLLVELVIAIANCNWQRRQGHTSQVQGRAAGVRAPYRIYTPGWPFWNMAPDLPERVSITATLIGSSGSPGAVRLVPAPLRANPHGLSASPMGPAQAPLPCSTGCPIAYFALLTVFPHPGMAICFVSSAIRKYANALPSPQLSQSPPPSTSVHDPIPCRFPYSQFPLYRQPSGKHIVLSHAGASMLLSGYQGLSPSTDLCSRFGARMCRCNSRIHVYSRT
jgi:hypothetical protein